MLNLLLLIVALMLPGCGKVFDKFSRLDEGFTRVELHGGGGPSAAMNGGIMVIFKRIGGEGGSAFGFSSAELADGRTVVIPNGSYQVLAYGSEEASGKILEGQAKCGLGNGGSPVNLSGGGTTVSIVISAANCGFGTNSIFSDAEYATYTANNFDNLLVEFCSTQVYPGCDVNVSANYHVKFRLMGGHAPGKGEFLLSEPDSLTSACSGPSSSGVISSSFLVWAGSDVISPPAELLIYSDSACSGPLVGRIRMNDGIRQYRNAASGSSIKLSAPASSNSTYLKIKFP